MLPKIIEADEILARVACGSSKLTKNRSLFYKDDETGIIRANVALFIDARNPAELSVNRISTMNETSAHELGLTHKNEFQALATYWGYAELKAEACFKKECQVIKDDIGGKKPYHANIIYPISDDFIDTQMIATYFSKVSTFKVSPHV